VAEQRPARKDEDGLLTAAALFAFFLFCSGVSGYLYWQGTGKLPWQ
jgi:hypothetical protein